MDTELIELAQALIRIPSVTAHEKEIAQYIVRFLEGSGLKVEICDDHTVIGVLRRDVGPTILLDSHIDTVDANPSEWHHPPFAAVVEQGKLYGRGASDMKGALASMLTAVKHVAQDQSWKGTLVLTGTSWEEYFEGHTLGKAIAHLAQQGVRPDYVIIGEASEMNLKRGQRGRTRLYMDIKGKASHSAHPEEGINAIYKAVHLIQRIRGMNLAHDEFLGQGIVELIGIESRPHPVDSVVPYYCRLSYDLRLLPGQTKESVLAQFGQIVRGLTQEDPELEVNIRLASGELLTSSGKREVVETFAPAWKLVEEHELVQRTLSALRGIGLQPRVTKYGFCTNGSYSAGIAAIPTIGFGPGQETMAHVVDEYICIDALEKACAGYIAILQKLLTSH